MVVVPDRGEPTMTKSGKGTARSYRIRTDKFLTPGCACHTSPDDQPNILVVMADQLAPHFTGTYGHPW